MARVAALAPDLFFASKIEATLTAAGHEVTIVGSTEDALAVQADVVVADLHAAGLDAAALAAGKAPVLGFYSHVDETARDRGRGCGFRPGGASLPDGA